MLLLALDGFTDQQIAEQCRVSVATVRLWIARTLRDGVATLQHDAPGRGRRSVVDAATLRSRLGEANLLDAAGRPTSLRVAAMFLGVSASAVWRALKKQAMTLDSARAAAR